MRLRAEDGKGHLLTAVREAPRRREESQPSPGTSPGTSHSSSDLGHHSLKRLLTPHGPTGSSKSPFRGQARSMQPRGPVRPRQSPKPAGARPHSASQRPRH